MWRRGGVREELFRANRDIAPRWIPASWTSCPSRWCNYVTADCVNEPRQSLRFYGTAETGLTAKQDITQDAGVISDSTRYISGHGMGHDEACLSEPRATKYGLVNWQEVPSAARAPHGGLDVGQLGWRLNDRITLGPTRPRSAHPCRVPLSWASSPPTQGCKRGPKMPEVSKRESVRRGPRRSIGADGKEGLSGQPQPRIQA